MTNFASQITTHLQRHIKNQLLKFDAEQHHYFVKGKKVRSVSSIVTEYDPTFAHKMATNERFRKYCQIKAQIGTHFHATTEELEKAFQFNNPFVGLMNNVDESIRGHIERWWKGFYRPVVEDKHGKTLATELALYHPLFNFCGTLDRLFLNNKEEVVLVDYKTGAFYPNHEVQLALYGLLCEWAGVEVDKYVVVSTHATKGGVHEIDKRLIKAVLNEDKLQRILKKRVKRSLRPTKGGVNMKQHLKTWLKKRPDVSRNFHSFCVDEFGAVFGLVGCESGGVSCRPDGPDWEQISDVNECFPNEQAASWGDCDKEHCSICCDC